MRKLLVVCMLAVLFAALLAVAPAFSARKSVRVDDNFFVKPGTTPTVRASRGGTVEWEWEGRNRHNVTVTRGPVSFHSPTMRSGTYSKKLRRAGTYKIICTIHPTSMRMTLRVG
jgi:plastocyanin